MEQLQLPKNVQRIDADQVFTFCCHPGVDCFTQCCRQLELALTPYDVLRLKKATGLTSSVFLDRYVIIEKEEDLFPRLYLTMVDDGRESCVFVAPNGCTVYENRPGACRAYPTGRATSRREGEFFVLLQEEHCRGFQQSRQQTPRQYSREQGLSPYNRFNDAVATILQHDKIRQGMALTQQQMDMYLLSLYDLDSFREKILMDQLPHAHLDAEARSALQDDEALLLFAIDWLKTFLFGR
jgi:Fe-S-cluster containining protein